MLSNQGLTFIETMTVLTIISLLCFMTLPALLHFTDQASDEILKTHILNGIVFAQREARSRGIPVILCKSRDQKSCLGSWEEGQIIFADINNDGSITHRNQILAVMQMNRQQGTLHWRSFPFYRDDLVFFPNGWTQSDNGTFWYCHRDHWIAWAITVNKAGNTRVLFPNREHEILDGHGKPLSCGADLR